MNKRMTWDELSEHYSNVIPVSLSNYELAHAVIYSLTSMDFYNRDDEYDDDLKDNDACDEDDENTEDIDEVFYEASYIFWQQRCKAFQFELWQRGFEAIRVQLYERIYIPILQPRGYNIPIENLILDFCSRCSLPELDDLINLLAAQGTQEAFDAAAPFVTERQKRLN